MPQLFMIVNEDRFFLSHRKDVALRAAESGFDVTIVAKDTGRRCDIESLGLKFIDLPINPTGFNVREELKTLNFLIKLYRKKNPDIVHHVGLKNILWGSLAAKLVNAKSVVNAVSGLGIMFNGENLSFKAKAILNVIKFSCHRKNIATIFQNEEDKQLFLRRHIIADNNIFYTRGSGVDLNKYVYKEEPQSDIIQVIFTARMLAEKGVCELIRAAESLKGRYFDKVRFILCGGLSSNPDAIEEDYLKQHCDGKYLCWLGYRSDVKELLENSHIMCFPSYYREGVPKSLIEAAAIGRPIITTNSIGCKDTVIDGYNGFLVPVKDSKSLAEKLLILIENPDIRRKFGTKSRLFAEKYFSLEDVIHIHLKVYNTLIGI